MASGFNRLRDSHEELNGLRDPAIDPTISGHLGSDFAQDFENGEDFPQSLVDYDHKPTQDLDYENFNTIFEPLGKSRMGNPYLDPGAHEKPAYFAPTHGLRQHEDPYSESSSSGSASRQSFDQAVENIFQTNGIIPSENTASSPFFDDLVFSDSPEEGKDEEDRAPVNGMGTLHMQSAEGSPIHAMMDQRNGIAGVTIPDLDREGSTTSDVSAHSLVVPAFGLI